MAAATCAPAYAVNPSAAEKKTWTVSATAQLSIATQYAAASNNIVTAQGAGTPSLLPSAAGVCAGSGAEVADNLTFGALTPSTTVEVGCDYQNAVAAEVATNDSLGFKLNEFVVSAPAGITFCAFPSGATNGTAAATVASGLSGNPAAWTGAACAAGGTVLAAGSAPAGSNPGQSNPIGGGGGTAGLETATAPGAGNFAWGNAVAAFPAAFFSEDIQINLAANQASAAGQSAFLIIQLIPN
jgi:hypothetical protein